jgi:predicted small secreted protein
LAWNPNAHGQVFALAVIGTTVYVGGDFDSIGGQRRHHIAALDATTGHALAWNPNANNTIRSLAVSGGMVYAGGYFDTIGGQNRNHIAALNTTSGNALIWNPNADGWVNALAVIGTTVYAAGYFTSIGGQNRSYIAALDATTGNALAWNPNAFAMNPSSNVSVHSLAVSGTAIYVGGELISMGKGAGHYYFAQFDSSYNSPVIQPVIESSGTNNIGLQIIGSRIGSGAFVKFSYALSKPDHVSLRLYTLTGRLHSVLINTHQPAGNYSLTMQRGNLAAGAYLVSFKSGDYHQEKMIFLMR